MLFHCYNLHCNVESMERLSMSSDAVLFVEWPITTLFFGPMGSGPRKKYASLLGPVAPTCPRTRALWEKIDNTPHL